MGYPERQALITGLQDARHSRVVCFVLSDRESFPTMPGFAANMASDAQIWVRKLLREIGHVDALDLFLYTRGGATESVWPLVNMLRDHCDRLSVLVPFRAHSAGTMVCLGADEIIMSDGAELSPIDPATGNQFNPRDPNNPAATIGISVEDVQAYFEFADKVAGIRAEQYLIDVLRQLTAHIHPLALGNVQRVYLLIGRLARELMALHRERDDLSFDRIVTGLTTGFYSHTHAISRREAQALLGDDWVVAPDAQTAVAMDALFNGFADDLHLREKFNLPQAMGDQPMLDVRAVSGYLETDSSSVLHQTDVKVTQRPQFPPGVQVPPGQVIPIAPFAGRTYDFGIQTMGWVENGGGI
jgi:serine dehydrogenase proteinase